MTHMEVIHFISGEFKKEDEDRSDMLALCQIIAKDSLGLSSEGFAAGAVMGYLNVTLIKRS